MFARLGTLSKKQALRILIGIFLVLGFAFYYFIWQGHSLLKLSQKAPDTIPATAEGPWNVYRWHDHIYSYPSTWKIEEIYPDKNYPNAVEGQIYALRFSPEKISSANDFIQVGGGKTCKEMKLALCLGSEPVYTFSKSSEVLSVFSTMVKHLDDEKR